MKSHIQLNHIYILNEIIYTPKYALPKSYIYGLHIYIYKAKSCKHLSQLISASWIKMFYTSISKHIQKLDKSNIYEVGGTYLCQGGLPRPNRGLPRVRGSKPLVQGGERIDPAAGRLTTLSER
jgi:hypothetical protein